MSSGFDFEPPPFASWRRSGSLPEILDRARRRMDADTCTLLLVDRTRTVLEPAAAVGLDDAVRSARPVPIGRGFAGRVAQDRAPVFLDDVHAGTVVNPLLVARGVRTLLGVPITIDGQLLGVLHVGRTQHRTFTESDAELLGDLAQDLGEVLQQRFIDSAQSAALTLQRSLLPSTLHSPEGIELAARYIPAEGNLGGDWYDVFELPDERLAIVMGDVAGHGLESAIIMGRLRSALRAYALEHEDPAEILTCLDQKICHFEPDALASVLMGIANPPYNEWTFSSAGHLAPIIGLPDGSPSPADIPTDQLLGLAPDANRQTTRLTIPGGGLVCLYTDGLVERRPAAGENQIDIIEDNIQRVCTALDAVADVEEACSHVISETLGDRFAEDDIALLVGRLTD